MNVIFNQAEALIWEQEIDEAKRQQQNPYVKRCKDPRKEKLVGFRRSDKYFSYGKENTFVKKTHRRTFRSKCKNLIRRGQYENLPNKKIGTQGWETW